MPLSVLHLTLLTAVLAVAVYTDLRFRTIPNRLVVVGMVSALALGAAVSGGWPVAALAGAGLGLAVGVGLFALGALGAGDGKLLAVVGAFLGPQGLVLAVLYGGVAGGVLALVEALRRGALRRLFGNAGALLLHLVTLGHRGRRHALDTPGAVSVPYGVAIAVGALAAWFFPALPGGV